MTPAPPLIAYLCLAASMALVGSYVGLSKWLVAVFPIFLLAWLRFAIGAVAMLHWLRRGQGEDRLSPRERGLLFLGSLLGNVLFSICMLYGVALTSAVAAGISMAAIPAAVALLSWLFLRERISARVACAIVCASAGIALLALGRGGHAVPGAPTAPLGQVLLLCAVFCESSFLVIGRRLTGKVSPRRISAILNLWGLTLITPLGLWQALHFNFSAVAAPMWLLLVFYSLAASVATVWLWMQGLRHVPAAQAGVFAVVLPISAAAVGVVVLGEAFSAAHVAALGLALLGLLLATWPGRKSAARS